MVLNLKTFGIEIIGPLKFYLEHLLIFLIDIENKFINNNNKI
jgi:hypothetical protein